MMPKNLTKFRLLAWTLLLANISSLAGNRQCLCVTIKIVMAHKGQANRHSCPFATPQVPKIVASILGSINLYHFFCSGCLCALWWENAGTPDSKDSLKLWDHLPRFACLERHMVGFLKCVHWAATPWLGAGSANGTLGLRHLQLSHRIRPQKPWEWQGPNPVRQWATSVDRGPMKWTSCAGKHPSTANPALRLKSVSLCAPSLS